eukprot:7385654-Ditylum_brightwellii.AAC.1
MISREVMLCCLLCNAEEHSFMVEHQYGGQRGKDTTNIPILIAWQREFFTITRHNVAFTDCDAKACYNRVIPMESRKRYRSFFS